MRNLPQRAACSSQLQVEQDPWITDEEERSRYADDALLIGSTEMLMAVAGRLMVVPRASNTMNEPGEPVQEELLLVLLAESGITSLGDTDPVEAAVPDEGQGGSLESKEFVQEPSTLSTAFVEEPLERYEGVDGSVDGSSLSQHTPATPAYRCSVYGCGQGASIEARRSIQRFPHEHCVGDGGVGQLRCAEGRRVCETQTHWM